AEPATDDVVDADRPHDEQREGDQAPEKAHVRASGRDARRREIRMRPIVDLAAVAAQWRAPVSVQGCGHAPARYAGALPGPDTGGPCGAARAERRCWRDEQRAADRRARPAYPAAP